MCIKKTNMPTTVCLIVCKHNVRCVYINIIKSNKPKIYIYRMTHEMPYHFIFPLKLKHHSIDVANVRVNAVVHGKWRTTGG